MASSSNPTSILVRSFISSGTWRPSPARWARALGNPSHWGLDAAVPTAFLALVWHRLETTFLRAVAAASVGFCLLVTPVLPVGLPIVATTLVALVAGWRVR